MELLVAITILLAAVLALAYHYGQAAARENEREDDLDDARADQDKMSGPLPDAATRARAAMRRLSERFPGVAARMRRTKSGGADRDR